jgi:hypothetical protein
MARLAVIAAAVLVAPVLPASAETTNHSGTIGAVDRAAGTIALDEVGPWRVRGGTTEITRRTIAVTPSTEFKLRERAPGAGPAGWIGEFVEKEVSPEGLKVGDFVTVKGAHEGRRLTALAVTVVRPSTHCPHGQ